MARRCSWEDADPADDPMPNTMAVNLGPTVRGRPCRLLAACLACLAASGAVAEPRVALVVGNNAYEEAPLDNPLSDASLIAGSLRELRFEVSTARNADEDAMEEAIVRLGERLRELGPEAVGLFYYAGHGVQSTAGRNYLIPVGAAIRGESRLAAKAVSADWVLETMRNSGNAVNVLILDACRNNPYVARRGARGLAAMVPGSDSLIAFSAAAGQTAEDGDGDNSAYAAALAAEMRRPGLTFAQVFQNVRKRVLERQRHRPADERQTPTEVSQLTRDHYFVPPSGAPVRIPQPPQPVDWAREEWEQIKGTSNAEALEAYIGRHRDSRYAVLAKLRLGELRRVVAGQVFSDVLKSGGRGPEMVVIPAGRFRMGCLSDDGDCSDYETPVHEVRIGRPFALGVREVTREEFGRFVDATGRSMGNWCESWRVEGSGSGRSWRSPGFRQSGRHPVVCESWNDAKAYAAWLSRETGETYRLPSESEWEYAARAGTGTKYHFGNDASRLCRWANCADLTQQEEYSHRVLTNCRDGHVHTAPTGSFEANGFGLHDMHGNVQEWVEDCWNGSYAGAPSDGVAWVSGDCAKRVLRGGTWGTIPRSLRAAYRDRSKTGYRDSGYGFRVARTLTP